MGQRRERRCSNAKYTGKDRRSKFSPLKRLLRRYFKMCRKSAVCPEFERRTLNGIKSACENCEYIKREKKALRRWRIALLLTFLAFVFSTYIIYQ